MAKHQQTLSTVIVLNGQVDNSFTRLGSQLQILGSQIDTISGKVIEFGEESTKKYVDYDDIMREVKALGEYDAKSMEALDAYNKSIAQNSKFTMEQAAQTEVLMAQLGLDIEQISTLNPSVLNLAKAAKIELADSLDYLYYSLNALQKPIDYADTLTDQMAKTAAISAADIDTLGKSMQRLGSGAQFFTGGSSELLAILGGISQFGKDMQGSDAGTQLRNFMLTLLAPTGSKATLMETFGVTEDAWSEFESYMDDAGISVTDTADTMNELGLTVYDATGKLKPAIQIIAELDAALSSMSDADKNAALGSLFGKRTTITAKNLLSSLSTIIDFQHQIEDGSEGYTEAMGDTMEGGLGGSWRDFLASWDALQVTVGETGAPLLQQGAESLTSIVNSVANLDEVKMSAMVGGLGAVGAAGPALLVAGGALRLIGSLASPVGRTVLAITAIAAASGAVAGAVNAISEKNLEERFGSMELDSSTLIAHINGIGDAFDAAYASVDYYNSALNTALANYESASSTLSGNLLTNMVTGATLTDAQKANLSSLGESMGAELMNGMTASFDKSTSYLNMLFGGDALQSGEYMDSILAMERTYDNLVTQAQTLGREFGETLGAAMDDGIITGDEYKAVMDKMQAYNEAMAIAAEAEHAGELALQMHKAQSVSWDSASDFLNEQYSILEQQLEEALDTHVREKGTVKYSLDQDVERGMLTEDDRDRALAEMDRRYENRIAGYRSDNAEVVASAIDALMSQSGLGEAWNLLSDLQKGGMLTHDEGGNVAWENVNWAEYLPDGVPEGLAEQLIGFSDGWKKVAELIAPYSDTTAFAGYNQLANYSYSLGDYVFMTDPAQMLAQEQARLDEAGSLTMGVDIPGGAAAAMAFRNEAQATLNSHPLTLKSQIKQASNVALPGYAEGGRATMPSIFGEAGPEWAIPEEHTQRVASLLNAAREGAGFTWPELIARNGGMNAGGGSHTTLIYQPTIVAADAAGVEEKLIEDKTRLDRWWSNKQLHDDVEVYA